MKEFFQTAVKRVKNAWSQWTVVKKLIFSGILIAVIGALVFVASFSAQESRVSVFGSPINDVTLQDRISGRLEAENIAYTVSADGTQFLVNNEATARRARALLVREGINLGQVDPWALFDVERWTQTDLMNKVSLQRSLTQQLKMHIESLDDVDYAAVNLAFPKDQFLADEKFPVTASVVITPRPGSDIADLNSRTGQQKVRGLVNLIRFAIPELHADNITITDNRSIPLNDFNDRTGQDIDDAMRAAEVRRRQQEQNYVKTIHESLSTVYPGRVRVLNVNLTLNNDLVKGVSTEVTPIILKPRTPGLPYDDSQFVESVKLSEQVSQVAFSGTGFNPQGPAGIEGQTPPAYQDLQNTTGVYNQNSNTINYIVNQSTTEFIRAPGTIERLTAAVVVDGVWSFEFDEKGQPVLENSGMRRRVYTPMSDEDLRKVQSLVQDALGSNPIRSDSVSVSTLQFDRTQEFAQEDGYYRMQQSRGLIVKWTVFGLVIFAIFLLIYRAVVRENARRKREREEETSRQHQAMREAALRSLDTEQKTPEMSQADRNRLELQDNAIMLARERPEDVAQLIRTWLSEEN